MNTSLFSSFARQYPVTKTLRFELKPMGATLRHIQQKGFLHKDEELAKIYKKIKELLDEYHRAFIADTLGDAQLVGLDEFYADYQALKQDSKNSHLKDKLTKTQDDLRKQITKNFEKTPQLKERYQRLFTKELFKAGKDKGDLEKWLINHDGEPNKAEKISWIHQFENFTTYFQGLYENRKNMYSDEAKHTAIAYRLIHENLPRFVDNIQVLSKIKSDYPDLYHELNHLDSRTIDFADFKFDDVLQMDFYHHLLIQSGITAYNTLLGGKVLEGGKKLQGINELINLYGQKHKVKIAKLKPLHKQILSDGQSVSFLPKKFDDDYELCQTVNHFYREYVAIFDEMVVLFQKFYDYDKDNIYINHQQLNQLSHELFADFGLLSRALDFYYCQRIDGDFNDKINNAKSQNAKEKLLKEKERYTKSNHSINELQKAINHYASHHEDTAVKVISDYFSATNICNMIDGIHHYFSTIKGFLEKDNNQGKSYLPKQKNSNDVKNLKVFLDGVLRLIHFIKPLALKSDDTLEKEEYFYGEFMPLYDKLVMFTPLYNKVRDYISQKPYNDEKIKLNFGNSTLLNGWDVNKEKDNFGVILCKEGLYYLAILDKTHKKVFDNAPKATSSHIYQKMVYKLLPGPNKMLPKVFFAKSNIGYYQPSAQLLENYEKGTHKKGSNFSLTDCHHLIDFFKSSIAKHPEWKEFGFKFSDTHTYQDLSDFYKEIEPQAYKVKFIDIDADYIDDLVEKGQLYLFQLYNKDFSKQSYGKPNLHTLYFKALFSDDNLKNPIYKLNGEAEMFYRCASLSVSDTTVHQAGEILTPKNPNNTHTRTLSYDVIKNKRYTTNKFFLHIPITMNFGIENTGFKAFNHQVNTTLKNADKKDVHIIGIDRGERHLLYISVIDGDGRIVEQRTLNDIVSISNNGMSMSTPYHQILDNREKERSAARTDWGDIETIKELKAGYLSHVVHEVVQMMLKYNAIIVLEDLNFGFKRGRFKVEKQVYQNFENALIKKLNYLVLKNADNHQLGSVRKALQLTNNFTDIKSIGKQTGFIFYVPAWNTSKIDPTTGFVDLLKPRYENMAQAQSFISRFKKIAYNHQLDYFEFEFDYADFYQKTIDKKRIWTLCTYGDVRYYYDHKTKETKTVNVTKELKSLLDKYDLSYQNGHNLVNDLANSHDKSLLSGVMYLLKVLLALRYSHAQKNEDFILSPVMNKDGAFFDSRFADDVLPNNADANGAYHIALKGLWVLNQIQSADNLDKIDLSISNEQWLHFTQSR